MKRAPDTLWVDVGGTRTTAWRRTDGRLRRVLDGPSDVAALPRVVRKLRSSAPSAKIVAGLRGVWTAGERSRWRRRLGLSPGDRVISDIELAHELAFEGSDGILLNAGTGSIAFGRLGKRTARAGGLGPLIGDDGSGFWIGREYLRRVVAPRRGSFRLLRGIVTSANPVAAVAAQSLLALRDPGPASRKILQEAVSALVGLVVSVETELRARGKLPIAVRGGLFENSLVRDRFARELNRR